MSSNRKKEFKQRWNFAFALFVVFGLILATNLLDRKHFRTAQDALKTVYEDRVVAQHYLFEMNTIIYQKEEQFLKNERAKESLEQDAVLQEFVDKFAATKLTRDERREFEALQQHLATLEKVEAKYRESAAIETPVIPKIFKEIKNDLNNLSEIQMSEGKNRTQIAQKSLDTNHLLSKLELGLLLVIGILLQVVIFYRVKNTPSPKERNFNLRVE